MQGPRSVTATALGGIGEVRAGDDVAALVLDALHRLDVAVGPQDVVVVAQKIVSKAEGRLVALRDVVPSARARELAARTGKAPELVELILSESREVLRVGTNLIIVRHRLGYVMANAGIDQSNVQGPDGADVCLLLPLDPEASAQRIRAGLGRALDPPPAVIVSDSFGRPWRRGVVNIALGSSGLPAFVDRRGELDRHGRVLRSTEVAFADSLAALAGVVMGEADEGTPAVLITGTRWSAPECGASTLIRPEAEDLFR